LKYILNLSECSFSCFHGCERVSDFFKVNIFCKIIFRLTAMTRRITFPETLIKNYLYTKVYSLSFEKLFSWHADTDTQIVRKGFSGSVAIIGSDLMKSNSTMNCCGSVRLVDLNALEHVSNVFQAFGSRSKFRIKRSIHDTCLFSSQTLKPASLARSQGILLLKRVLFS